MFWFSPSSLVLTFTVFADAVVPSTGLSLRAFLMSLAVVMSLPSLQNSSFIDAFIGQRIRSQMSLPCCGSEKSYLFRLIPTRWPTSFSVVAAGFNRKNTTVMVGCAALTVANRF